MGKQTRLFRDVEIGGTIVIGDHRIHLLEKKGSRKVRVEILSDAIVKVAGNDPGPAQECLTSATVRGTQDGPDNHCHRKCPN